MTTATPQPAPVSTPPFAIPSVFTMRNPQRRLPRRSPASWMTRPLESWTGLQALTRLYNAMPDCGTPREFFIRALDLLNVRIDISAEDRARIPREGAVMIVANHPFGAIEGLVMGRLLCETRPDFKFMANYILTRIPELREALIAVDPFGGRGAGRRNFGPMRQCLDWLRQGGALGVFPAGEVAHPLAHRRFMVTDPAWNANIGGLARHAGVPVLPVYFSGRNSLLFQTLGLVHPRLRTAMLARELLNKRGGAVEVRVGQLIPAEKLAGFATPQEATDFLRFRTFLLQNRAADGTEAAPAAPPAGPVRLFHRPLPPVEPVAAPLPAAAVQAEVKALPPECLLAETDEFAVYLARASRIPKLMYEIGRQRELTFRKAGEGTLKGLDLDEFDSYYEHLFVWHKPSGGLVGAYRIGKVDRIVAEYGPRGLYTHSLFRYRAGLLAELGPALELGRSFIVPEYQRSFSPLLLLWKGIGQIVVREPQYKYLLGPVSVSNDYNTVSRQLLAAFLRHSAWPADLAGGVRPRSPLRPKPCGDINPQRHAGYLEDLDELSKLIADIEPDGKGVPVLLRQYLKMGGVILGLNVDAKFNDCLDGLVLVDLTRTERRLVEKYLGREGGASFLAAHGVGAAEAGAVVPRVA